MFISLSALAIAVSLDGFGVGVSYGIRKIRIPFPSIFIFCSYVFIGLADFHIGLFISDFLSVQTARKIGAFILITVGYWAIYHISVYQADV